MWDIFNGYHMGVTAENVARQWQITREEQDKFATASDKKAQAAKKAGKFKDEIAPVTGETRKGETVVRRGRIYPRGRQARGRAAPLKLAFDKEGTVTAANASGINDGAAAVVMDDGEGSQEARSEAPRPHRLLGGRWRRPQGHGLGPDPGLAQGAQEGRLEASRISI